MQHKKTGLALALLISSIAVSSVSASVLTFDDLPGQGKSAWTGAIADATGYQGYVFDESSQWVNAAGGWFIGSAMGAVSGDYAIVNSRWWVPGVITTETHSLFTFDGLWAKKMGTPADSGDSYPSAGTYDDHREATVSGFKDGAEVWSIAALLNGSYQYLSGQSEAIDTLKFTGPFGSAIMIDNLALNAVPAAVPLPAAAWLFGSALVGFSAFTGRKSKKIS